MPQLDMEENFVMANTKTNNTDVTYSYSPKQRALVESHIEKYFGPISFVLSQVKYQDILLDIAVIEPDSERNFYVLVTLGLGSYQMHNQNAASNKLDRCELMIMLDPSWVIPSNDEDWYWPIRLLKEMAHEVIEQDHFLDWGYCYSQHVPFAPGTQLSYAMLCGLNKFFESKSQALRYEFEQDSDSLEVAFYLVLPMYQNEYRELVRLMDQDDPEPLPQFVEEEILNKFISQMRYIKPYVNNNRDSGADNHTEYRSMIFEDMRWHSFSIDQKKLAVEPLAALNHIAFLLRYMIENDMMSPFLSRTNPEVLEYIHNPKSAPKEFDLRKFIEDELAGVLDRRLFNQRGLLFLNYYFNDNDCSPKYSADIDSYALRYFGVERYYSKEFDTEGYLFVPYNEKNYQNIKAVIDARRQSFEDQDCMPIDNYEELKELFKSYLDCQCYCFPSLKNDTPIQARMSYDYRTGVYKGYIPVIIEVNDSLIHDANDFLTEMSHHELVNSFKTFTKPYHHIDIAFVNKFGIADENWQFDIDYLALVRKYFMHYVPSVTDAKNHIAETWQEHVNLFCNNKSYLKLFNNIQKLLEDDLIESDIEKKQLLEKIRDNNQAQLEKDKVPRSKWPSNNDNYWQQVGLLKNYDAYQLAHIGLGPLDKVEDLQLSSYWDEEFKRTTPLIIARIPVTDPRKILPYLSSLYSYNEKLLPFDLCDYAAYLYETYNAIPAVIASNGIEFLLLKPLDSIKAISLAYEILLFGNYIYEEMLTEKYYPMMIRFLSSILIKGEKSFFLLLNLMDYEEEEDDDDDYFD